MQLLLLSFLPGWKRPRGGKGFLVLDCVNRVNLFILALIALAMAGPAFARDSLGVFGNWGAFRDPAVPRCYAIAIANPTARRREYQPFAAVASWPRQNIRGQVHFRMSRLFARGGRISVAIGKERFALIGGGADAWAADRRMDAAIVATMRSASSMTVSARDARGNAFSETWSLAGAATAMDAAAIGCAQLR